MSILDFRFWIDDGRGKTALPGGKGTFIRQDVKRGCCSLAETVIAHDNPKSKIQNPKYLWLDFRRQVLNRVADLRGRHARFFDFFHGQAG
jgi:hypothetical protein